MCVFLSLSKISRVSERQHEGNIWERAASWHKNRKVSAWEAWIAVRTGMPRNSNSQTITCVCLSLCHLGIASRCKVPMEKLRNGSTSPKCPFCSRPVGWQLSHPALPISCLQPWAAPLSELQPLSKQIPRNIPNFRQSSVYKETNIRLRRDGEGEDRSHRLKHKHAGPGL